MFHTQIEDGFMLTKFSGIVTSSEVVRESLELMQVDLTQIKGQLVDDTELEDVILLDDSIEVWQQLSIAAKAMIELDHEFRIAIVIADQKFEIINEKYIEFLNDLGVPTQLFYDMDEAKSFIGMS